MLITFFVVVEPQCLRLKTNKGKSRRAACNPNKHLWIFDINGQKHLWIFDNFNKKHLWIFDINVIFAQ
jgi:hypothetical protein